MIGLWRVRSELLRLMYKYLYPVTLRLCLVLGLLRIRSNYMRGKSIHVNLFLLSSTDPV